jgi:hypothetical protein
MVSYTVHIYGGKIYRFSINKKIRTFVRLEYTKNLDFQSLVPIQGFDREVVCVPSSPYGRTFDHDRHILWKKVETFGMAAIYFFFTRTTG